MTWFEQLTGIAETSPEHVRKNIVVTGDKMKSLANGREWIWGDLETPSLGELRARVAAGKNLGGKISVREIVADTKNLHTDTTNAGALIQVASQFNLLEMVGPNRTPEDGIGIYENDHTQGPACAIACGAGTIYRNYFVPVNGRIGQTHDNQIDCLADIGAALGNENNQLWKMQNGYVLPSRDSLEKISKRLRASSQTELNALRKSLRIGIQWNTQVTRDNCTHLVSQAYCSALPRGYAEYQDADLWEDFAALVLDAAYEATLCAAILNSQNTGNNRLFLTLVGGGVFRNEQAWILQGLERALRLSADWNLDVVMVSYGSSKPMVQELVRKFS